MFTFDTSEFEVMLFNKKKESRIIEEFVFAVENVQEIEFGSSFNQITHLMASLLVSAIQLVF
jgi:ethanolamine utilization protein EutA (predicted chaperonin)